MVIVVPSRGASIDITVLTGAALIGVGLMTGTLAGLVGACVLVRRPSDVLYEGGYLAISVLAVVLVASAAHPSPGSLTRALSVAPLRLLGLISYGVYLWHWPVFYLASANRLGLSGIVLLAVQLAITIALATASYVLIETPIRQKRLPFTR